MMRRFLFACSLILLSATAVLAADGRYAVSGISPVLRLNADAVVRLEEIRFELKGLTETIRTTHYVITILNENGDRWAEFSEYYDNSKLITSFEGFLYDANGGLVRKVKKKDLLDYKTSSVGTFVDDGRVKVYDFNQRSYPYTIEYTVGISSKSSMFFPQWTPLSAAGISVEKSMMSVICPVSYQFRYKAFLYNGEPAVTEDKNSRITTWTVINRPAITKEPYSPRWHELTTTVILGPTDFQVDDYKGNMQSWENFGKFVYALKSGRDQLPDNIRAEVHQIADGLAGPHQKIKALYEYMQRNTHYVGIQLGIGGWQPFDAKYVAANRYGDCKALVNYTYSLLKEAGINSFYTLVRAGRNEEYITSDFPSQQFNHVILCVPVEQDTIWLECTSQTLPAGYLSDFTADRFALLVDENGGHMVHTPRYGIEDNRRSRHITASMEGEGSLEVKARTSYSGLLQDHIHGLINNLSREKVKEYLHEQLDFPTYEVSKFDYKEEKTARPFINESLDISVSHYATVTGRRLFIIPNVMTRWSQKLSGDSTRRYPIEMKMAYSSVDSVEIVLLPGYEPESLPADVELTTAFGTYRSSTRLKDGKIFYYRRLEQFDGRFAAGDYAELVKFYDGIYKADRAKVVLVKK